MTGSLLKFRRRRRQVLCPCGRMHELSSREWKATPSHSRRIVDRGYQFRSLFDENGRMTRYCAHGNADWIGCRICAEWARKEREARMAVLLAPFEPQDTGGSDQQSRESRPGNDTGLAFGDPVGGAISELLAAAFYATTGDGWAGAMGQPDSTTEITVRAYWRLYNAAAAVRRHA